MEFPAEPLACGWLSVALASAKDKDRPQLNRTVCVELYPDGARLSATDSYVVLHVWVPNIEDEFAAEPEPDEAPMLTAVAMDPYGRGKGFMAHMLKLARADDAEPFTIKLTVGQLPADDGQSPTFDGLEPNHVILEVPDHEKITMQVYDGAFPNWRKVLLDVVPEATTGVALDPEIVGRLAKLGPLHGAERPLVWRWAGDLRPALIEVGNSDPFVSGAVMPVRWDFDADRPLEEVLAEEAEYLQQQAGDQGDDEEGDSAD